MSHEYRKVPKEPGTPDCFSLGQQEMELDKDTIERFDLGRVLDRIGEELLEQMKSHRTSSGNRVVGFRFHSIGFTYLLENDKEKSTQ